MPTKCTTLAQLKNELANAGDKLVVIDFFATWCGPCIMIAPKFEELAKNKPQVLFLKVDVDENEEASQEYGIQAMPTFVLVKNGVKVTEMRGANYEKLKTLVEENA